MRKEKQLNLFKIKSVSVYLDHFEVTFSLLFRGIKGLRFDKYYCFSGNTRKCFPPTNASIVAIIFITECEALEVPRFKSSFQFFQLCKLE